MEEEEGIDLGGINVASEYFSPLISHNKCFSSYEAVCTDVCDFCVLQMPSKVWRKFGYRSSGDLSLSTI